MPHRPTLISALLMAVPIMLALSAVLVFARRAPAQPTTTAAPPTQAAAAPQPTPLPAGRVAPSFEGGGAWVNSKPLALDDLTRQGKVVLIDFWTYGCYNCQNTLPYVKQWWDKYKDRGLVIVGVHTPEFSREHVLANVRDAVEREGIGWPVVQDNDYAIWRAYGNHYWPRFYLVDRRGQIVYDHIGEGAYDETERWIVAALEMAKEE
jgi:thiol-disulfide isomerase/thioredoxin